MEINFTLSCRRSVAASIAALLYSAPAYAASPQEYQGAGVVGAARCAEASVFRDQSGNSYELDNSRTALPKGVPVSIRGKVYPRISVCKQFPWLDVASNTLDTASGSGKGASGLRDELGKRADGAVVATLESSDITTASAWLIPLAARPDISKIFIRMSDKTLEDLPALIFALGPAGPEIMKKMEIAASSSRPEFSWTVSGRTRLYKSTMELRNALFN